MAIFFPSLNTVVGKMQSGERRFARKMESVLEDDYLCWYDVPIGPKQKRPDFTLFHPGRGLLILEVKDWKADTIKRGNKHQFELATPSGRKQVANPFDHARQYTLTIVDTLERDPQLQQHNPAYKGKLVTPWGYGVVFSNITRQQAEKMGLTQVIDERLILCKDELAPSVEAEAFQERLWQMFNYQFRDKLTQPQIDRIRAHLWPEIIVPEQQGSLLGNDDIESTLPDVIKVMDYQQEQIARSMGEGHRIIHGVAGSGKTMILGFRCLYLAKILHKPILVLCFNITLAAKLRSYVTNHNIGDRVQVSHFHDWCGQQLKTYHVSVMAGQGAYFDRQVQSVIQGVEKGQIPRAQYGAMLIDEAHDFDPDWLQLITGMVDPETNALLLLYDDAQSIYKRQGLGFSLSSVGIQARGRTKILKLNYRNTQQILDFAYAFAQSYMQEYEADEDSIPLIRPEAGGKVGQPPVLRRCADPQAENEFIIKCLRKWQTLGRAWRDIAIVFRSGKTGARLARALDSANIPFLLAHDKTTKSDYDPEVNRVSLLTIHSSKGLEFATVVVAGIGEYAVTEEDIEQEVRLLYIAMTRAMDNLLLVTCGHNTLTEQLQAAEQAIAG